MKKFIILLNLTVLLTSCSSFEDNETGKYPTSEIDVDLVYSNFEKTRNFEFKP